MPETGLLELFKFKTCLLLILFFVYQAIGFCQVYPDQQVDSVLRAGINSIILQDYTKAEKTFLNLDKKYSQLPLGKIYLAAVQIAKSYDYGEKYNESYIDSSLNSAKDQAKKMLDNKENNIWYKYFLSLSEGYLAYFKALNTDWLEALSEGTNALDDFEDILKQDKNFYEAYIAIGTFKYWKSRKTEFLDWLPGHTDEKDEGIKLLEEAIDNSSYNRYLAINSLIWIYIDQKNFSHAVILADSALTEYPGSRFFMWGLARAYEDINPEKSIEIYYEILNSLPANLNHYDEIVLKHLIAQEYVKMGENQEAINVCNEILSIKITDKYVNSKLKNRLKRVEELKTELSQ